MATKYKLSYTGKEIDEKLGKVDNAITYSEQTLTYAQQAQAKRNIGLNDYVTPQMFGAKADGITDDTSAINAAMLACNNVYFPKGTYLVDGSYVGFDKPHTGGILVNSNQHIIMDNECIIQVKDNITDYYNAFAVSNCENVIIEGGKIIGDRPRHPIGSHVQGYGISFTDAKNCVVRGVEISEMYADGIITHGDTGNEIDGRNTNIVIENCIIHDCNRQGMSIVIGDHITVRNCEIYNIKGSDPQSGIDIEPLAEGNHVYSVRFDNLNIHDTDGASIYYSRCYDITFTNMRCDNKVQAVGFNHGILHDKCFYKQVVFNSNTYDVIIKNSIADLVYLYGDAKVKFINCIMRGQDFPGHLATIIQAPLFTGQIIFEGCQMILMNTEDCPYNYILWTAADGTEATGDFIFRNCSLGIIAGSEFTYLFKYAAGSISCYGCSIDHVSSSQIIAPMPGKLQIIDCDLSSKSNLGFVLDSDREFVFEAENSRMNIPQYLFYLTAIDEFTSEYSLIITNNIMTSAQNCLNKNATDLLINTININNYSYSNI